MPEKERYRFLLQQYRDGEITEQQRDELFRMTEQGNYDDDLEKMIDAEWQREDPRVAGLPPHVAEEIMRNILSAEANSNDAVLMSMRRRRPIKWVAAASVFALLGLAAWLVFNYFGGNSELNDLIPRAYTQARNNGTVDKEIILADGSTVQIKPGAVLHYPEKFAGTDREVFLEGAAFFDVQPDAARPFKVFCGNIITQVLGTSFNVEPGSKGSVTVTVLSGKVQVMENARLIGSIRKPGSVIVTPNHKSIYDPRSHIFVSAISDQPRPLQAEDVPAYVEPVSVSGYHQGTKLGQILTGIEDHYGVEIIVENDELNNCLMSGDLSSQDLYRKLDIICLSVNARYEVNGNAILIKGKGCQ